MVPDLLPPLKYKEIYNVKNPPVPNDIELEPFSRRAPLLTARMEAAGVGRGGRRRHMTKKRKARKSRKTRRN